MKNFFDCLWNRWKKFARILGRIQIAIILTLLYLLIFTPWGLIARAIRLLSHRPADSNWKQRKLPIDDLTYFRRQG